MSYNPEEVFDKVDVAYEYGKVRDELHLEEKMILDIWYKNSLLEDENVKDDGCFVSKSLIEGGGDGLFANKDFKKGDMISEYPSTNIFINGSIIGFKKGKCHKLHPKLETQMGDWVNKVKTGRICLYNIDNLPTNERFRGFKANDFAYKENINREEYDENKNVLNNVFYDDLFSLIALRDINKGEEIGVSYGFGYWTRWGNVSQN